MQRTFKDQLSREVLVEFPPKRIISLVPSQTELLFYLGLDEQVVGITIFCVHPEHQFRKKDKVGGTKRLKMDKIDELQPDLIIGNREENEKSQIEALMKHYPVWMSDVRTLENAFEMIASIGEITNTTGKASGLSRKIEEGFTHLAADAESKNSKSARVAYLIWKDPFMAAGAETFVDSMLQECCFQNVFSGLGRYPEITSEMLAEANPELILLSSEPFPFKEKHVDEVKSMCPEARILLVDGEMFSWYGSRLLEAPVYFSKLLIANKR